jgi:regulator of CtrA degradation
MNEGQIFERLRSPMHRRLVDTLFTEAMLMADEARGYFEEEGRIEREALPPALRVCFSCESLKVTTRLMHVIAWLLTRRAVDAGELTAAEAMHSSRRLGEAPVTDAEILVRLPRRARLLTMASAALYDRALLQDAALARAAASADAIPSPVHSMQAMLASAL